MRVSNRTRKWLLASCVAVVACGGGSGGDGGPATWSISGVVTGTGAVTVTLGGAASRTTTTDAAGAYSFSGLADGSYAVTPSKPGYVFTPPSRPVNVVGASVSGQDFVATATHSIAGTVTGADSVTVELAGTASRTTTTDGSGAYAFAGLLDGAYTVTPSKAGFTFAPANRSVTVSGADVAGQDFAASPIVVGVHSISGTVTGTVVEGVTVSLGGAGAASTTTDAAGAYSFAGLSDGDYTVTPSLLDASGTFHVFSPPRRPVTVSGADVGAQSFSGTALVAFDDFAGGVSGTRWDSGEFVAVQELGAARLSSTIDAPDASTGYGPALVVAPGAVAGRHTEVRAAVRLVSSAFTGDVTNRAGIELVFQPPIDRVAGPDNWVNALRIRVALQDGAAGLVAVRQVFACTAADCSTTQGVGTVVSGGGAWPQAGLGSIALDTPYTLSVRFDGTSRFTFALQGGAHASPVTAIVDVAQGSPPPVDVSRAENFYRTRLAAQVRGNAGGTASAGSLFASFDDVWIGFDGQDAAPFDDFEGGTTFDPARWTVGGAAAQVTQGLEVLLRQRDSPAVAALPLNRALSPAPSALQARVRMLDHAQTGPGRVGARLAAALYNDGSSGLVPPPTPADVSQPGSQVGDVIAQISLSAGDVSYAVIRCNVAVCLGAGATGGGVTYVVPRTSLRTTAVDTLHHLLLRWDAASHQVVFQVDDRPPAVVDPTAGTTGVPVSGPPHREFWQIANHATSDAPGVDFGPGSSGSVQSRFELVKRL